MQEQRSPAVDRRPWTDSAANVGPKAQVGLCPQFQQINLLTGAQLVLSVTPSAACAGLSVAFLKLSEAIRGHPADICSGHSKL